MAQLRSEGDRVVHRAVVRSQPQCWDGSINEKLTHERQRRTIIPFHGLIFSVAIHIRKPHSTNSIYEYTLKTALRASIKVSA
jgi:hypothetical protein